MQARLWCAVASVLALAVPAAAAAGRQASASCRVVVIEGEVRSGQGFHAPVLVGVQVELQPIAAGWLLRVEPTAHAGQDWAEMATPPYRSITPLLVSTDYSFRAQDAIGWNPRRFRFAASDRSFAELRTLRQAMEAGSPGKAGALAELAGQQPEGVLDILDAHLVPGTADQARTAGMVAGHFAATAHQLEQPAGNQPTPLGALTWMRFRVSLELPRATRPAAGTKVQQSKSCLAR